jgi:RES domain
MPPTITQAYPPLSLAEVAASIAEFQSTSLEGKQAVIRRLISVHPIMSLQWGQNWRYRRVRILGEGEVPAAVDELIWRKSVPARLGRASPGGFQVLYLADRLDTALREVGADKHHVVIAEFQVLSGQSIRVAPVGELAQIQRTGRGFLSGEASSGITKLINACKPEEAKSLLITDSFLLECLTNADDNYEVSSTVAIGIFDKDAGITAVSYPSRRQFGAINFAVRVERFWESWGLSSVRRGQAIHLAQGYYRLADVTHVEGITHAGNLRWRTEPDEYENAVIQLGPLWTPHASL